MDKKRCLDSIAEAASDATLYKRVAIRQQPKVTWHDGAGTHETLLAGPVRIGSAPGNEVEICDPTVSRIHAELESRDGVIWVRDLGSRNGTFVSNVRVREAEVPDGGAVVVGRTALSIERADEPSAIDLWPKYDFENLVGRSLAMRELFAKLHRVAKLDSPVLLQGEVGTGKEGVAEAIHLASPRRDHPFVVVDCTALPESLLEAELFGHTKGAFTCDAAELHGAFRDADGGTLFLDDVSELPAEMQPKVLRALETHSIRRVGESNYHRVDVRVIAATNRDLRTMVNEGSFREDLYFRLGGVSLHVPALRHRCDDIPILIQHFAGPQFATTFSPPLLSELMTRPWPGNVRELRNFVERITVLGIDDAIALSSPAHAGTPPTELPAVSVERPFKLLRDLWLNHLERVYVSQLLERHQRNLTTAAAAAGMDRTYLHRLIRKHGL